MRVVVFAMLALSLSLCGDAFGEPRCVYDETDPGGSPQTKTHSIFRGIGLASRADEVQRIARSLGYHVHTMAFVDGNGIAGINLYGEPKLIGRADFDRQGRMLRLSLKDRFFCDGPIFVRRFADTLFERYGVKPIEVDDDVCFQDVTCFKGVSKHGEQFLILRIGSEADLYVRP
jgi:hypothetical protein